MKIRTTLLGFLMVISGLPLGAGDRIALKVSPSVSFAPANLILRATIAADERNRAVEVEAESSDFYRSSQIQLDGKNAPRTTMFEFRGLPGGMYEVKATLFDASGDSRGMVRQQVNVISGNGQ